MSYKEDRIPKRLLSNGSNSMMRSNEYSKDMDPRACGCVQPPYSAIENISVQKLTPEYKIGMEPLVKTKTPPMMSTTTRV
ncbi:hypothetical protein Ahy_A01g004328 isoform B [Arachis hypogaea]|uniref:Uncharacterized protein n=1 Tax=Arachis hypogaea TaxID=3818 RepID=A0A445EVS0_ARAHY|nr:hypothetical protein Ahy_A01g004328 isoform B [Arachis hypogaea]